MRAIYIGARTGQVRNMLVPERLEDRRLLSAFVVTNLNDSGPGSLRQAILDANSNPGADSITFDATLSGVISLTGGEMQISDEMTIAGPGRQQIYINGNASSRIFNITSAANATIQNLVIEGGQAPAGAGGGILNAGILTLINDQILDCKAGAGIPGTFGDAGGRGGGILSGAQVGPAPSLTVIGCMISGNRAGAGVANEFGAALGGDGGGIASEGTLVVRDSTFITNVAGQGGPGTSAAGSARPGGGGGSGGAIEADGQTLIVNSTFCYNTAGPGGSGTTSSVTFSTSGGGPGGSGGAIFTFNSATMVNDTVAGNSAGAGGPGGPGVPSEFIPPGANGQPGSGDGVASRAGTSISITIGNSLITHNLGRGNQDVVGNFTSLGHNLIGTTPGSTGWIASDMTGIDLPLAPSDNGGPTRRDTCALMAGSPALDHGDNALLTTYGITTDKRGLPRIFNGTVDIGAYEAQPPAVAGDVTHDGKADFSDLLLLAQWYGKDVPLYEQGDLTGDGKVQFSDLLILAQNYGQGTAPAAAAAPRRPQSADALTTTRKPRVTRISNRASRARTRPAGSW